MDLAAVETVSYQQIIYHEHAETKSHANALCSERNSNKEASETYEKL